MTEKDQIWPDTEAVEAYLIDYEIAHSADVNEFLTNQIASDVVAGQLHTEILHDSQLLPSYLRADNQLAEGEEDKKDGQEKDLVQYTDVFVTE